MLPMTDFDHNLIKHLQKLSRLALSEKEEAICLENLRKIVNYVDCLTKIPTESVEPCIQVIPNHIAPLREDEPFDLIAREELLRNAPEHAGGMIKVPKVIKELE